MSSQLSTGAARRIEVAVPGGTLAALRSGDADDPPALLLPGYTGSKEDFGPIMRPLARAGFAVTAIDQRGQYESPGPDDPAAYRPDRLAQDVLAIARDAGAPLHLVGHSYGGLVARAAVLADPSAVRSLILLCSGPAAIEGARRAIIEQLRPLLPAGLAVVYEAMQHAYQQQPGYVAPDAPLADFLRTRFLVSSSAMIEGMGDAITQEPDRVAQLHAAGVPVLVLAGDGDDAWPPAVQADMARRLGAPFRSIRAARHSPAVENPDATARALIDFWRACR